MFAPTDAAFAKVPKADARRAPRPTRAKLKSGCCLYTSSPGRRAGRRKSSSSRSAQDAATAARSRSRSCAGSSSVDGAKVVEAGRDDLDNGVIHVIDCVAAPEGGCRGEAEDDGATATAAGSFKTLTSLLTKAGLASTLQGKGPFTVFAPTDAAFARVPKATLTALGKDRAKLRAVLLYHVVKGNVPATRVVKLNTAKTLNGQSVGIRVTGGKVFVDGARVTTTDVKASNGLIHVVNRVLIPLRRHSRRPAPAHGAGRHQEIHAWRRSWSEERADTVSGASCSTARCSRRYRGSALRRDGLDEARPRRPAAAKRQPTTSKLLVLHSSGARHGRRHAPRASRCAPGLRCRA